MKKDETVIQDKIIDYLKEHHILHWRMSGASNMAGFPDLLLCVRGRFVALEIKTPVGKPTLQQMKVIGDIAKAGGIAHLVSDVFQVRDLLVAIELDD